MFEQYVPDLDKYLDAWNQLSNASKHQKELELRLDAIIADVYIDCTSNPAYEVNGKAPAISLIKESYAKIGHTPETREEIVKINSELVDLEKEITELRGIIKTEEMKLSLYQTMSANSRNVVNYE